MKLLSIFITTILTITTMAQKTIYDYTVTDNKGQEISLSQYKGQVILIINTATHCGFTPQYEVLEEIYDTYKDKGFIILDFPCNQFGAQAPGSDEEIEQFCTLRFNTKFPRFQKIEVNGINESPLYTFLKSQKGFAGFDERHPLAQRLDKMFSKNDPNYKEKPDIKWNFTKFLIDKNGTVIERFEPTADKETLVPAIEKLLK